MDWLIGPEYWLARLVFQRLLGLVYFVAFLSAFNQFPALVGERGLLPAPRYLRALGFRRAPSLFHLRFSDRFARGVAAIGLALSAAVIAGALDHVPLIAAMVVWAALWLLYLSFVNAGQTFFGFVWETLLVESGFLAIFLGNGRAAPLLPSIFVLRWLLFRLEVGAGLIKLRNDQAWRNLTALYYHHETQPLPNGLSAWFHRLPRRVHKLETLGNHIAQLVVPFGLFLPQPFASIAGTVIVLTQLWLMASGNFAWLNVLTLTLAVTAFDNSSLGRVLPVHVPTVETPPTWFTAVVIAMTFSIIALSWKPVRNMVSARQVMNASYNRLHIGNSYGLFGRVTRDRLEVIIEGTDHAHPDAHATWKAYEFKAKPGDVRRRPRQVAPYHLRLDWLMWFAALSPMYAQGWFVELVGKLLRNDPQTLRLLRTNPFPHGPPRYIRVHQYRYWFATRAERRASGAWWQRELIGEYLPPVTLRGTTAPGDRATSSD